MITIKAPFSFLFIVSLSCTVFSMIELKGFVPPQINEPALIYEYKRIHTAIAPFRRIDMSAITVTFFSEGRAGNRKYSLPEWGGGGAIGRNTVVVNVDTKPFLNHTSYQITVHELVHIAISRICDTIDIPRWFHEGLAMVLSAEVTDRENIVISKAIFSGSLMRLAAIDSVNGFSRFRAELAYSQSRAAALFLIDSYGMEIIPEIIRSVLQKGSFWEGFHDALQISQNELEALYIGYVMKKNGRFLWLLDYNLLWACMALLFLAGYAVTMMRVRQRRMILEMEDAMLMKGDQVSGEADEDGGDTEDVEYTEYDDDEKK